MIPDVLEVLAVRLGCAEEIVRDEPFFLLSFSNEVCSMYL